MSALSSGKGEKQMLNRKIAHVAEKIVHDGEFAVSYEDACGLAALPETDTMDLLFCANHINKRFKKSIIVCSIINAKSGLCSEDCAYCAQSSHHQTGIETYPPMLIIFSGRVVRNSLKLCTKAHSTLAQKAG